MPEVEEAFNQWYDAVHVPALLRCPGWLSARRYVVLDGGPKYLAIYEVDSAEIINSPAWQEASDLGEWKPKIRPHTTNRQHSVFRKIA